MTEAAVTEQTNQQESQPELQDAGASREAPQAERASLLDGIGNEGKAAAAQDGGSTDATWRKLIAGEDERLLGEFSRFQSPADLGKDWMRQKQELSKRRQPMTLPENASPEQVAEYRKALGIPEQATVEAYGIKAPEGFELSDVQKGAFNELVSRAHAKHIPPAAIKEVADVFFKAEEAQRQAMNAVDAERNQANRAALRQEFGKDLETMLHAGDAWLDEQFGDDAQAKAELLNARLPGGGKLSTHPFFIRMVANAAMENGLADRIEGNEMEASSGKSLAEQQREIESWQFSDPGKFQGAQDRLDRIIAARLQRGEIDEQGNERRRR
jgi:hypothetical protein